MPKATITSPVEHDGKRLDIGDEIVAGEAALAALEAVGAIVRKGVPKPAASDDSAKPAAAD